MPGNVKSFRELFYKNWVGINFMGKISKTFLRKIFAKLGGIHFLGPNLNVLGYFFAKLGGYLILGQNLKSFGVLFCSKGVVVYRSPNLSIKFGQNIIYVCNFVPEHLPPPPPPPPNQLIFMLLLL